MPDYTRLDAAIIEAIKRGAWPWNDDLVAKLASDVSAGAGREAHLVIDGRLQAMRRNARNEHLTKMSAVTRGKRTDWNLRDGATEPPQGPTT